jgi:hypothetical protein
MRRLTIILVSALIATTSQAEKAPKTPAQTTTEIVNWLQSCAENALQTEALGELMEMDCVFNAVKYCGILEDPTAINTCNDALSATFDANVAQAIPKLETYAPESRMRKGSWQSNLAMLKENKTPPCPVGLSQAGLSQTA